MVMGLGWLNPTVLCPLPSLVVIDLVKMVWGSVAVMRKHEEYVNKLHKAITTCKDKWFKYLGVLMVGWARKFLSVEGAHGNM
jgi:hypothetical protein